ncbi:helix-turn-helix domain-containing protein [Phenylobacterium sp. Root700]|uniref:helix-turn-helix domain-containing protein n=1 Tax=Phenylobacterium sp. Root700 TaxID=1736591 RepID=UPI0009E8A579|nr:helix-turn-helix transcriptional regulator [Phenylobacterium sp. Root700]
MPKSVFTDAYAALIETLVASRKSQGVTQVELANRLNKPQSFVSKIEQGQRRVDVVEFCAIAHALELDAAGLFQRVLKRFPRHFSI